MSAYVENASLPWCVFLSLPIWRVKVNIWKGLDFYMDVSEERYISLSLILRTQPQKPPVLPLPCVLYLSCFLPIPVEVQNGLIEARVNQVGLPTANQDGYALKFW